MYLQERISMLLDRFESVAEKMERMMEMQMQMNMVSNRLAIVGYYCIYCIPGVDCYVKNDMSHSADV